MSDRYRYVVELLVLAFQASMGLNFVAVAPLMSLIIEDYQIERATASLLIGGVSLMLAVFMVPASVIAAKLGVKRAYTIGALLMSAGILAPLADNFLVLLFLRLLYGAGVAFVMPVTGSIVMSWFSPRTLPMVNSINVVGQSLAITCSTFAAPALALLFGWRVTLSLFGGIALATAIAWVLLGRVNNSATDKVEVLSPKLVLEVMGQRTTLLLGIAFVGVFGQYIALTTWLPTYYNQVLGLSLSTAGQLASLLPLFGIVGSLSGGFLSARLGVRRPFLIIPGMMITLFGLGSFLSPNLPLLILSVCLLGIASWIYLPAAFTIPMEISGMTPERVAMVLALALSLGNFAGFLSPLMVGFLTDRTGSYVPGLVMASVLSVSLFFSGRLLPETGPKSQTALQPDRDGAKL